MANEEELFEVKMTPELAQRLTCLTNDMLKLLEERTQSPEEALIALDVVGRELMNRHNMFILAPIDAATPGLTDNNLPKKRK